MLSYFSYRRDVKEVSRKQPGTCGLLHLAAGAGHRKAVETLLRHKADLLDSVDHKFRTPLMRAASYGDAGTVKILLSYGPDLDKKDAYGKMAIDYAREQGHDEVVLLLD